MDKLVREQIARCGVCLQHQRLHKRTEKAPLNIRDIPNSVGACLHVDYSGPHTRGDKTFYLWGCSDAYSKYLITGISKDKKPTSAFKLLMNKVVYVLGCPLKVTSDKGKDFTSELVDLLHKALNITRTRTSPYNPRANSTIEIMWKHLNHIITKNTKTYANVEELLQPATFAINSSFRKSTGLSANEIIFNFTPNTGALFQTMQWKDGLSPLDQFVQSENRKRQMFQAVFKRLHDAAPQ